MNDVPRPRHKTTLGTKIGTVAEPPSPSGPNWTRVKPGLEGAWLDPDAAMDAVLQDTISTRLREAEVDEILLLHGTFVGTDVLGILRSISRYLPSVARWVGGMAKSILDSQLGPLGNFDSSFRNDVAVIAGIPVRRHVWNGENNHLARLAAIVELLDHYTTIADGDVPRRVLVLSHSHGGNVMAMLSKILADPLDVRREMFEHLRWQYQLPILGWVDRPAWKRVADALSHPQTRLPKFDVVTLGAPIRYRWGEASPNNLLHIVNHHPIDPDDPNRAILPRSLDDLLEAKAGDYIQHLGVAGTDLGPSPFAFRDWSTERKLSKRFEPDSAFRDIWNCLQLGNRIAPDGHTLLVDYPRDPLGIYRNVFGHAIYTHRLHLPFHLDQITRRFYERSLP